LAFELIELKDTASEINLQHQFILIKLTDIKSHENTISVKLYIFRTHSNRPQPLLKQETPAKSISVGVLPAI